MKLLADVRKLLGLVINTTTARKVTVPMRHVLIISPAGVQHNCLLAMLRAVLGPVECAHAATLEEGAVCLEAWRPDLVLIALNLSATTETRFFEQLRALRLDTRCLLLADVKPWLEWQWGPWADRVLLAGFSFADLARKVRLLLLVADGCAGG